MIRIFISSWLFIFATAVSAQSSHKLLRSGDKNYESQDYAAAEESYRKSLEKERSHKGKYNLGNTVYNQDRHEEAIQYFEEATSLASNDTEKSDAFYNLGNAQFKNQQLKESIESYKQSLRLDPSDTDARKNLFLAKMAQQQQQQQQQQQEQQQEQQEQNNEENDQQQEQEQQDQQQQQESDQQPQQQGEENPVSDDPSEEQMQQDQKLSKEDAERLLQIIENEEKKVQEKLKKVSGKRTKPEKDW